MPGTRWPAVDVSVFGGASEFLAPRRARNVADTGGESLEDGIELLYGFSGTANHHAVAAFEAPNAAAGSDIDVVNALLLETLGTADIIFEVGVAAVDDGVSRFEELGQRLHGLLGGTTGRHHDPYRARGLQFVGQILQGSRRNGPFASQAFHGVGTQVGDDHLVTATHQAARHIRAHFSQAHHSQLHRVLLDESYSARSASFMVRGASWLECPVGHVSNFRGLRPCLRFCYRPLKRARVFSLLAPSAYALG